jgi:gentisate 1,2-dioxygenase
VDSSPWLFPWTDTKEVLDRSTDDWSQYTYRDSSGSYISNTLGAIAERVKAGTSSLARRDTCSYIYHVQSGSGKTAITLADGTEKTVYWEKSDTFAVPAWSGVEHFADTGPKDSYLFALTDMPLLEELYMYIKA